MEIDVIIPSYTNNVTKAMVKNCIISLRESEKSISFNVVIIESKNCIVDVGADKTIYYCDTPFVYNRSLNIGIKETKNEWIILANNDLIFHHHWMTAILQAHDKYPNIKSFTPWNNQWNWHPSIFGKPQTDIIEGYRICQELGGWCIVCKRDIFDTITLSERVKFWYSDNVYADALIEAGIKHALVTNSYVDHLISKTKVVSQLEAIQAYNEYCNINND